MESINLYGTKVTDAGVSKLSAMPNLKRLYLWQTAVTPAAIKTLKEKLPELRDHHRSLIRVRVQRKYPTPALKIGWCLLPGMFLATWVPARSEWAILPKTRPQGVVMPSMAASEPFGLIGDVHRGHAVGVAVLGGDLAAGGELRR